jgi:hypothetical protein
MTMVENPKRMTVSEANKHFYPYSYLMVECEEEPIGYAIAGIVIAYAELEKKGEMVDYSWDLCLSGEMGEVVTHDTRDILDGGTIWVEQHDITRE